jgi:hypothetical protein
VDAAATEWRRVGEEVVVLNTRTARYLALNRSAAALWPSLVEGTDVQALAGQLRRDYGLDEADAVRDAAAFVDALRELEVLERPAASS